MDGNGRWAEQRGLDRSEGHQAGVEAAQKTVKACCEMGIGVLSLFAFSCENWLRPKDEVELLMRLFIQSLTQELAELTAKNIRLQFIGDRSSLSPEIQALMQKAEQATLVNEGLSLIIALNYTGRWDIVNATKKIASQVSKSELSIDEISERTMASAMSMAEYPLPDLLIRTSGEQRISNFLLWQLAYTELYFTPTYWPDFDALALSQAIEWYDSRERRFGLTSKQVNNE